MVVDDMSATEKILAIFPMHERIRGQDVFHLFKNYIARTSVNLQVGTNN